MEIQGRFLFAIGTHQIKIWQMIWNLWCRKMRIDLTQDGWMYWSLIIIVNQLLTDEGWSTVHLRLWLLQPHSRPRWLCWRCVRQVWCIWSQHTMSSIWPHLVTTHHVEPSTCCCRGALGAINVQDRLAYVKLMQKLLGKEFRWILWKKTHLYHTGGIVAANV